MPLFSGSIPENYERSLGPFIFEPYAVDLAARVGADPGRRSDAGGQSGEGGQSGAGASLGAGARSGQGVRSDAGGLSRVLETACGTGRVTAHLRSSLPEGVQLIATDLNPDMIATAKKIVPLAGIHWQVADAQALPFADNYFDVLVSQFGLMFMPDKPRALAEAHRVLAPGGRLLLSTWDSLENNPAFFLANQLVQRHFPIDPPRFFYLPFSMYDKSMLLALVTDAGFTSIRIELVKKEGRSASAADAVTGMLEGSPMHSAINERDPALMPVLKKELAAGLAARFGNAPMVSQMQAWVVEGVKS